MDATQSGPPSTSTSTAGRPVKVCHIITGLGTGGAETMLTRLIEGRDPRRFPTTVISLMDRGQMAERLEAAGAPVETLNLNRGRPTPAALFRLRRLVEHHNPDVIHAWMYHANLGIMAGLGRPFAWNIRQCVYDLADESRGTQAVIRLGGLLSPQASAIVYNSRLSRIQHRALGYSERRDEVIPNGFDTATFRPSEEDYREVRRELGLPTATPLIGMVGRLHPIKDHPNLLAAMTIVAAEHPQARLVLVGRGLTEDNVELMDQLRALDLHDRVILLGERRDIPRITAAFDVAVLSSKSEGFPNVVGEAMACGVPAAVTDVGDAAWLLGEAGRVVPPQDSVQLARAISELLAMDEVARRQLGQKGRRRIVENFSLGAIVARYHALYARLAGVRFEAPAYAPPSATEPHAADSQALPTPQTQNASESADAEP
ncbi:glycosyltransferase [Lujinxingia vulgaris]|uniref:Glycosyltransferase n=1 Tax=Lujinxingia vulgaris TaxID=2600176 RepID=A0A5C6X3C9_9DELT|nr:glycosyltransferase [Lujinxingia vulgaris]TXD34780.1 glycosyltransferase [Lujinxingia vulgaris]